jgi:ribosomal silencing factor RsfS
MTIKEQLAQELNGFDESQLRQIAEYMAFLKFRSRTQSRTSLDEVQLAALYAEFADEDRALAEEGIFDYVEGLQREDAR